jgi:hypothetical protein
MSAAAIRFMHPDRCTLGICCRFAGTPLVAAAHDPQTEVLPRSGSTQRLVSRDRRCSGVPEFVFEDHRNARCR